MEESRRASKDVWSHKSRQGNETHLFVWFIKIAVETEEQLQTLRIPPFHANEAWSLAVLQHLDQRQQAATSTWVPSALNCNAINIR